LKSASGMRVALFSGNYNCTRDGANKALNKLVVHLLEEGAEVKIFSPTSPTPAFEPAGELVSVRSIAIPGRSEYRVALGLPKVIRERVRSFRPDIIHLSAPDWLGSAALGLGRQMNVRVVASMHTRFETYFEYYGLDRLRDWAWRRQKSFYSACDIVLAPNGPCREHLGEMGLRPEQIRTWGRGVETNLLSPKRRDLQWRRAQGFNDPELVILFLGRLVREKGIESFVRTISELRERGHAVRPMVIGSGPAEPEMRARLGAAAFVGHFEGEALGRAVASADILLNPSLTEAFGNVNLEAMAAGLAVVSADIGSAQALIENGRSGILCSPDPACYADAIESLLKDPARRMALGRAASASAATFRWPLVLEEVVRAYKSLLPPIATMSRSLDLQAAA